MEHEEERIGEVNEGINQRPFISVDSEKLPPGWYGGSKMLETPLYVGAFNYFQEEQFIEHLRKIKWAEPECVQLIIKRQNDDRFEIINVMEEDNASK